MAQCAFFPADGELEYAQQLLSAPTKSMWFFVFFLVYSAPPFLTIFILCIVAVVREFDI